MPRAHPAAQGHRAACSVRYLPLACARARLGRGHSLGLQLQAHTKACTDALRADAAGALALGVSALKEETDALIAGCVADRFCLRAVARHRRGRSPERACVAVCTRKKPAAADCVISGLG
jgi:hypothetical protein